MLRRNSRSSFNFGGAGLAFSLVAVGLTALASPPVKNTYAASPRPAASVAHPANHAASNGARPGQTVVQNGYGPAHNVTKLPGGGEVHRDASGKLQEVHTANGAVIRHAPGGERVAELHRPDGHVIVAHGNGGHGYVQRPFESHGQHFEQRTFMHDGHAYSRVYRPYSYGGRDYHLYAYAHYYRPGFYGWAYRPYGHPYGYRWGYEGRPWYGYYGVYYAPYPVYGSPMFWLTDFMVMSALEASYGARVIVVAQHDGYQGPQPFFKCALSDDPTNPMSPDVKEAIANEVKDMLEAERAAQEGQADPSAPPMLFTDKGPKVFLVSSPTTVYTTSQKECTLNDGEVLRLFRTPTAQDETVLATVVATHGRVVPVGTLVTVRTTDLQELANEMMANLDEGMAKLQAESGKGQDGLPAVPSDCTGTVPGAYGDAPSDAGAVEEYKAAVAETAKAEQAAIAQAEAADKAAAEAEAARRHITGGTPLITVLQRLGPPIKQTDLLFYQILYYPDQTIKFVGGFATSITLVTPPAN